MRSGTTSPNTRSIEHRLRHCRLSGLRGQASHVQEVLGRYGDVAVYRMSGSVGCVSVFSRGPATLVNDVSFGEAGGVHLCRRAVAKGVRHELFRVDAVLDRGETRYRLDGFPGQTCGSTENCRLFGNEPASSIVLSLRRNRTVRRTASRRACGMPSPYKPALIVLRRAPGGSVFWCMWIGCPGV